MTTGTVFVLGVLAPILVTLPGFTTRWIGALSSIYFGATVAASGQAGRLVDRDLPRSAKVAHVLVALGLIGLATGIPMVVAAASALAGVANAFLNPVTNRMVLWGHILRRPLLIALKQAGTPLGGLVVGAVLPILVAALGWQVATASLASVVMVLGLIWSGRSERGAVRSAPSNEPGAGIPVDSLRWTMAAVMALGMANGFMVTFLPLHATRELGWSLPGAGLLVVISSLASIAGRIGWTFVPAAHATNLLRLLCALGALGALGLAVVTSGPAVHVSVAVIGLSAMGWLGLFMRWLIELVPAAELGSTTARLMRPYYFGLVVSPAAGGIIADVSGLRPLWWIQAVLCLGALAMVRQHDIG